MTKLQNILFTVCMMINAYVIGSGLAVLIYGV